MFKFYLTRRTFRNVIITESNYPIQIALSVFIIALSFVGYLHNIIFSLFFLSIYTIFLLNLIKNWSRDLFIEFNTLEMRKVFFFFRHFTVFVPGNYRHYIRDYVYATKLAMCLFIISEIMFFFSFPWAYFHSMGSPAIQIGGIWPPFGLINILSDSFLIPLTNTLILITSGSTSTWSHHLILPKCNQNFYLDNNNDYIFSYRFLTYFNFSMFITLLLALNSIFRQGYEFVSNNLQMSDGIYGSCFHLLTGFHGLHVIIGTIFLMIFFIQGISLIFRQFFSLKLFIKKTFFNKIYIFYMPSIGFECAIWYWHFVDVVWLPPSIFVHSPDKLII